MSLRAASIAAAHLALVTYARVGRMLFDGNRCCGAGYSMDGDHCEVEVSDEVVLTASAIGSAQLMVLSGTTRWSSTLPISRNRETSI